MSNSHANGRTPRYNWNRISHAEAFTEIFCDAINNNEPWSVIQLRFEKEWGGIELQQLRNRWQELKKDPEFVEEYPQFSEKPVGEGTSKAQVARKRYAKQPEVVEAPEVEAPEIEFAEASPELVGLDHPKVEAMCDKQRRCNEAMRDQLKKLSDEIGIEYETLIEYVMAV